MRKAFLRLIVGTLILYVGIFGWLYFNQRSLLYFPERNVAEVAEYGVTDTQDLLIKSTDDTEIQIWYHKPTTGKELIIFYHGNYSHLGYRAPKFRELIDMGYGFIAPSYRGFGKSSGTPTKEGILNDARAAINFAIEQGHKPEDIILIGESLGSGVASQIATEYKFKGIMLITPYRSIEARASEIYWYIPVKYLIKDNFNNIDNISNIHSPILLVHGTQDDVIPHSHSEALIALANEPKKLILYEGKTHSNIDPRIMFSDMAGFFGSVQSAQWNGISFE